MIDHAEMFNLFQFHTPAIANKLRFAFEPIHAESVDHAKTFNSFEGFYAQVHDDHRILAIQRHDDGIMARGL